MSAPVEFDEEGDVVIPAAEYDRLQRLARIASDSAAFVGIARAVAQAWDNEGPFPRHHRKWQKRLQREWPALAGPVAALARLEDTGDR